MYDATPDDVKHFLAYRDKGGKTCIHVLNCPLMGQPEKGCSCPKILSLGTVKSMLGKLSSAFDGMNKTGYWQPLTLEGNPVHSEEIKLYVKAIQKEQSAAHVEKSRQHQFSFQS
jgi:hypothetical protein